MSRVGIEALFTVPEFYPHAKVVITNKQLAFPLGTGRKQHTCVVGISVPTVQAIRKLQGRCCENKEWRRHERPRKNKTGVVRAANDGDVTSAVSIVITVISDRLTRAVFQRHGCTWRAQTHAGLPQAFVLHAGTGRNASKKFRSSSFI